MALEFFKDKRVFVTGHTGFKGSWLCYMLAGAGADVTGYALAPNTRPNLFDIAGIKGLVRSVIGDIRDAGALQRAYETARPEIVLHLAAQPLVKTGYDEPVYTYDTNVMGTVHLLECIRTGGCARSVVNVTTDKVYKNFEWDRGYREDDILDGYDPYSNSKSCSELVTHSYTSSFLTGQGVAVSTARAGNVIGGGDFAADRIIPDCVRAATAGQAIGVRNPYSIRPFQHVLEPLAAYLMMAQRQYENPALAGSYNVGPDDADCVTTEALVTLFCDAWGEGQRWTNTSTYKHHEAGFLKLDNSLLKKTFGWRPRWHIDTAVALTVEWHKTLAAGGDVTAVMDRQIDRFFNEEEPA